MKIVLIISNITKPKVLKLFLFLRLFNFLKKRKKSFDFFYNKKPTHRKFSINNLEKSIYWMHFNKNEKLAVYNIIL